MIRSAADIRNPCRPLAWVALALVFAAWISGCRGGGVTITKEEALRLSRSRAEALHYPVADMAADATLTDAVWFVRLAAPPDRPGLDIAFRIDGRSGEILEVMPGPERPPHPVDSREAEEIAKRKAIELGYPVASMNVYVDRRPREFEVYFYPSGYVLGGDLTVCVDAATGAVTRVERGQ